MIIDTPPDEDDLSDKEDKRSIVSLDQLDKIHEGTGVGEANNSAISFTIDDNVDEKNAQANDVRNDFSAKLDGKLFNTERISLT